ncbi:hypothetical protein MMC30_008076 [Trapelia coarctata]|nr:hypothetical protein [Trapelia coarctata]
MQGTLQRDLPDDAEKIQAFSPSDMTRVLIGLPEDLVKRAIESHNPLYYLLERYLKLQVYSATRSQFLAEPLKNLAMPRDLKKKLVALKVDFNQSSREILPAMFNAIDNPTDDPNFDELSPGPAQIRN